MSVKKERRRGARLLALMEKRSVGALWVCRRLSPLCDDRALKADIVEVPSHHAPAALGNDHVMPSGLHQTGSELLPAAYTFRFSPSPLSLLSRGPTKTKGTARRGDPLAAEAAVPAAAAVAAGTAASAARGSPRRAFPLVCVTPLERKERGEGANLKV